MESKSSDLKATGDQATVLSRFSDGPARLEDAIKGLSEAQLDLAPARGGWSIREIVHHISDGDHIWTYAIKMTLGNEQAEFSLAWYSTFPQTTWAARWAYARRAVTPSLNLLKATRSQLLDLLAQRPDGWDCSVGLREPSGQVIRISVGFIVEMQANHVFHHIEQIRAIRQEHDA